MVNASIPSKTFDDNPIPTYSYLAKEIKKAPPTLAYIHVVDSRVEDVDPTNRSNEFIREIWTKDPGGKEAEDGRRLISVGDYNSQTGTELTDRKGDLVAFERWFEERLDCSVVKLPFPSEQSSSGTLT
ncbi:hypothetical protein AAF712_010153 [Marasmius tenuissimus]|uniref:Uncharacterized protein n=1 Tax=Marasmius tenuissimus TaxID=585030 RepID=A0ABR2ZP53_9AGAR